MVERPRVVLCTGISRVGRNELLNTVLGDHSDFALFDVGDQIRRLSEGIRREFREDKILDADWGMLQALRAAAFSQITAGLKIGKIKVVSMHATFRWQPYLMLGFDAHYINELSPDAYCVVIDDVLNIKKRMQDSVQWKDRLNLAEVITWQNEEMVITKLMAEWNKRPYFIIARSQPSSTIPRLFQSSAYPKAYLSFPISAILQEVRAAEARNAPRSEIEKLQSHFQDVQSLAQDLESKLVIFNPLAIMDLAGKGTYENHDRQKLEKLTVWRDYELISQSDMVICYYPVRGDSPGVHDELNFAFRNNKDVWMFYPFDGVSPFLKEKTTRIFTDLNEMKTFLEGRYGSFRGEDELPPG